VVTKRQLLVVDLAGSERILRSGAEGVAAAQAMAINTSLTALGKVVRALGAKSAHVPYRDSTLTQLLRSSLAGRACTSVVVTVASDAC
jgi:kinesin family protein 5